MAYTNIQRKRTNFVYHAMLKRCFDTNDKAYKNYGGRGITVCDKWRESFSNFVDDMELKPDGYSIERIDNEGNYEPSNCKWIPRSEQNKNKRVYKNSHFGISGIEKRGSNYRCRIRRLGEIIFTATFSDFFEACCAVKRVVAKDKQQKAIEMGMVKF